MQEQEQKPKARPKKRGYKAIPTGNYQSKVKHYQSAKTELEYICKINKYIQYGFGLVIRAELYKRGYTYRALYNLCREHGFTFQLGTITSVCCGAGQKWNLLVLYKLAYVLGIDLDPLQIPDAITYLRANGRSVKEF